MEANYYYAESAVKPQTVEITTAGTVYLRRDIKTEKWTDAQGNEATYWTYMEAAFSREAFDIYISAIAAEKALNGDDDLLAIMEAMADLYDLVSVLKQGVNA